MIFFIFHISHSIQGLGVDNIGRGTSTALKETRRRHILCMCLCVLTNQDGLDVLRKYVLCTQHISGALHFHLREGFTKKKLLFFWILSKLPPPPSPQFGQLVPLSLNAKNVDLSDIQNDSLSKILLK